MKILNKSKQGLYTLSISFGALILALIVCGVIIALIGENPFRVYWLMADGAFGSFKNIANTLANSIPLIFAGLAVTVASRAGILNLGVEGQLHIGAMCATLVGLYLPVENRLVLITAIIIAGMIGGAIWGLIPAVLKIKFKTNEVIVALMLNYIATLFTTYLIINPFRERGSTVNQTAALPEMASLAKLFPRSQLTTALFIALICAILVWFLFKRTTFGFKINAVGDNYDAARAGGINPAVYLIGAMLISGAIASMAGTTEIIGKYFRFRENFSPGFGFTGLAVAVLARNNPIGVIATAILFGSLGTGSLYMGRITGISGRMSDVIQSVIILIVAAPTIIEMIVGMRRKSK